MAANFCAWGQAELWSDLQLPGNGQITALATSRDVLLAGTQNSRIFRSLDRGLHWVMVKPGIRAPAYDDASENYSPVSAFQAGDSVLLAAFGTPLDLELWDCFSSACFSPTNLGGVFRSADNGATWQYAGLRGVIALAFHQGVFYASTLEDAYSSGDQGRTWKKLLVDRTFPMPGRSIRAIVPAGDQAYLLFSSGVSRARLTEDSLTGLEPMVQANMLLPDGNGALAATDAGLLRSRPSATAGATWETVNSRPLRLLAASGDSLLGIFKGADTVNVSLDGGRTWEPLPGAPPGGFQVVAGYQGTVFAGLGGTGVWSHASGSWTQASAGLYDNPVAFLAFSQGALLVVPGPGSLAPLYFLPGTAPSGTWINPFPEQRHPLDAITVREGRIYAAAAGTLSVTSRVNDDAHPFAAWRVIDSMASARISGIAAGPGWVVAFSERDGALLSCQENASAGYVCTTRLVTNPPLQAPLVTGTDTAYLRFSSPRARLMVASGDSLVFVRDSVYLSLDRGATWENRGAIPDFTPFAVAFHQGRLFLTGILFSKINPSSYPGSVVLSSQDGGLTWNQEGNPQIMGTADMHMAFREGELYIARSYGVSMRKIGRPGPWTDVGAGLPAGALDLAVDGSTLVVSLEKGQLYSRQLDPVGIRPPQARVQRSRKRVRAAPDLFPDRAGAWRRLDGKWLP
ncbi:MAG: hypothetical protein ABI036_10925 [Fibrobacteria bacterium]